MKRELLEILRCPECASGKMELSVEQETDEVRTGAVRCSKCSKTFSIRDGIINMLAEDRDIALEQAGIEEHLQEVIKRVAQYCPEIKKDITADPYFSEIPKQVVDGATRNRRPLALFEFALSKAKLPPNARVLDIGAGSCWTSFRLALKGYRPVATDIGILPYIGLQSHDIYRKQKKTFFERVAHDANRSIPFTDCSFQGIMTCASLHHIIKLDEFVTESKRLLSDNGEVIAFQEPLCGIWESNSKFHKELSEKIGSRELARTWFSYSRAFAKQGFSVKTYFCDAHYLTATLPETQIERAYPTTESLRDFYPTSIDRAFLSLTDKGAFSWFYSNLWLAPLGILFGNTDRLKRIGFTMIATKKPR